MRSHCAVWQVHLLHWQRWHRYGSCSGSGMLVVRRRPWALAEVVGFPSLAPPLGKTYLLKQILDVLPRDSTVATASTGVAACATGGMTLHAFAGVSVRAVGEHAGHTRTLCGFPLVHTISPFTRPRLLLLSILFLHYLSFSMEASGCRSTHAAGCRSRR